MNLKAAKLMGMRTIKVGGRGHTVPDVLREVEELTGVPLDRGARCKSSLAFQSFIAYLRLPGLSCVSVERFRADLDQSYTHVLTGDLSEEDARRVFHEHCFVTMHHDEKTEGAQYHTNARTHLITLT